MRKDRLGFGTERWLSPRQAEFPPHSCFSRTFTLLVWCCPEVCLSGPAVHTPIWKCGAICSPASTSYVQGLSDFLLKAALSGSFLCAFYTAGKWQCQIPTQGVSVQGHALSSPPKFPMVAVYMPSAFPTRPLPCLACVWSSWLQRLQSSHPSDSEPIPHILRANCRSIPWRESGRAGLSHSCFPRVSQRLPPLPQMPQECCLEGNYSQIPDSNWGFKTLNPLGLLSCI